jgi:putative endonuclease
MAFLIFIPMFYIYILYSEASDKYYIGHTEDYLRRLDEHNQSDYNTFTSKYLPWEFAAVFECGLSRGEAQKIEHFIKKQKSRLLIRKMVEGKPLTGILAQLVRVPRTQ